jgi:restriction system protein
MSGKRANKAKGPQFIRFFKPVIEVLQESDGSATSSEVTDKVIERLNISDEEQSVILKSGQSRVYNQIHWARLYLVHAGLIDSSKRGVWTLTDLGNKAHVEQLDPLAVFRAAKEKPVTESGATLGAELTQVADSVDEKAEESHREDESHLLAVLKSLSAAGFERLCKRLLLEHGFEQVIVTGKSGDGGIDGIGILQVNKFVSFTVLFQCKRFRGAVTPSQVRDFRGAMEGRADKGIIMTTGVFTAEAKKEARRDGAKPIELVNGDDLVELFQTLELGVKPRITYDVDKAFFDEYR